MPSLYGPEVMQAVRRASQRSAAVVHADLKEGLFGLATVAAVAPWVGLFGTVFGISFDTFLAFDGERSALMAAMVDRLSGTIWATAFGLLVGLISLWCYKYLTGRLETFDREMESASLDLVNRLTASRGRFQPGAVAMPMKDAFLLVEKSEADSLREESRRFRLLWFAGAALFTAWSVDLFRTLDWDLATTLTAAKTAGVRVLLTFGASCLLAHPVWARLLHRKPGALALLGSAICLCWCVAEPWVRSILQI